MEGIQGTLDLFGSNSNEEPSANIIEPAIEISAYEALWLKLKSVPKMAKAFAENEHRLPSQVANAFGISKDEIHEVQSRLREMLPFKKYSALFYGDFDYPMRLREAKNPIEVVYYQGNLDLVSSKKIVAVVGARKATDEGIKRTQQIVKLLVKEGYVIMSGLAEGVDTAAHTTALEAGGQTIAVIGTPLNEHYPKSNHDLQDKIAREHLLVSQVPFYLTSKADWRDNRRFFPERNITMSALSHATVIVEASDTSGTLYQARAAISQKRELFIMNSCFDRKGLKWPHLYQKKGAHKVITGKEIIKVLGEKGDDGG